MSKSPVALIILDGFGLRDEKLGNAVAQANKPNYDLLWNNYPAFNVDSLWGSGRTSRWADGEL